MELRSSDESARDTKSIRVRRPLTTARALARRHVSVFLYTLSILGVPFSVILLTGGPDTIGFWIVSLVWLLAVLYGAVLTVFIVVLAVSPVLLIMNRFIPTRTVSLLERLSRWAVGGLALAAFLAAAPLGDGTGIRLPVAWPNLGAVMVMGMAAASSRFLWATGQRLKPVKRMVPTRRHAVPEPDEEYWSDVCVVGWRSWNWDGASLRGVYARWPSAQLEATCPHCDVTPSWDHVCGIYAAKDHGDVHIFYGWSPIVGRVEMWGDVIEHERGYRASHARITDLWVHDHHRAERIRAAYPSVSVSVGSPRIGQGVA